MALKVMKKSYTKTGRGSLQRTENLNDLSRPLTDDELARVQRLTKTKYGRDVWDHRQRVIRVFDRTGREWFFESMTDATDFAGRMERQGHGDLGAEDVILTPGLLVLMEHETPQRYFRESKASYAAYKLRH